MEKYIVFIILAVIIYHIHKYCVQSEVEKFLNSKKVIENFADAQTVDGVDESNSINTLAKIAKDLQQGGLTVPGKLNFVNSKQISSGIQMDEDNYLRIKNKDGGQMMSISDNGTTYFGPAGKDDGPVKCGAFTSQNITLNGSGSIQDPNGTLRMTNQGIMFGGPNNGKEKNSAQISAGLHRANSLNIVGMSSGAGYEDRRVDVWAEGGFNINGSLCINGVCITADHLKMLKGEKNIGLKNVCTNYWIGKQSGGYITTLSSGSPNDNNNEGIAGCGHFIMQPF